VKRKTWWFVGLALTIPLVLTVGSFAIQMFLAQRELSRIVEQEAQNVPAGAIHGVRLSSWNVSIDPGGIALLVAIVALFISGVVLLARYSGRKES